MTCFFTSTLKQSLDFSGIHRQHVNKQLHQLPRPVVFFLSISFIVSKNTTGKKLHKPLSALSQEDDFIGIPHLEHTM